MKWVHKVVVNGDSAMVTIPRALMFRMALRPGEFLELTHDDDAQTFTVRPWGLRENATTKSPGLIAEQPEPLRR